MSLLDLVLFYFDWFSLIAPAECTSTGLGGFAQYVACLSVVMLVDNQRPAFLLMSASTANEGPVFLMTSPSKANDGPFSWLSFFSGQGGCF